MTQMITIAQYVLSKTSMKADQTVELFGSCINNLNSETAKMDE